MRLFVCYFVCLFPWTCCCSGDNVTIVTVSATCFCVSAYDVCFIQKSFYSSYCLHKVQHSDSNSTASHFRTKAKPNSILNCVLLNLWSKRCIAAKRLKLVLHRDSSSVWRPSIVTDITYSVGYQPLSEWALFKEDTKVVDVYSVVDLDLLTLLLGIVWRSWSKRNT